MLLHPQIVNFLGIDLDSTFLTRIDKVSVKLNFLVMMGLTKYLDHKDDVYYTVTLRVNHDFNTGNKSKFLKPPQIKTEKGGGRYSTPVLSWYQLTLWSCLIFLWPWRLISGMKCRLPLREGLGPAVACDGCLEDGLLEQDCLNSSLGPSGAYFIFCVFHFLTP